MKYYAPIIITFVIGTFGILQGAMNRIGAQSIGLNMSVFFTCFTSGVISSLILIAGKFAPSLLPDILVFHGQSFAWRWWYPIPGIFGITLVTGIPWAIAHLGTIRVTVLLVAGQMTASILWDCCVQKLPLNSLKIVGMLLAFVSTVLITWDK